MLPSKCSHLPNVVAHSPTYSRPYVSIAALTSHFLALLLFYTYNFNNLSASLRCGTFGPLGVRDIAFVVPSSTGQFTRYNQASV